jgi:S1-C subfamily serine protease
VTQRRLAYLAVAACAVLLLGLYIRGRLERKDQPPAPAPPSEASALHQLSQEGLLRRTSTFVSERAAAVARFVVYVPRSGASGVRWRADTVLSVDSARLIGVVRAAVRDSSTPAVRVLGDSVRNDWVLVVGRTERGTLLSMAGSLGGRTRARCGARVADELLLDVPLQDHLAGAGLFDLSGSLIGMVVRCGERMAAIPARQITALLAGDSLIPSPQIFGLSLDSLDTVARRYFGTNSGALVTAVRQDTPAHAAGLRPGDVLLAMDGQPLSSPSDVARMAATRPDSPHVVVRLRGRTSSDVRLGPRGPSEATNDVASNRALGIELTPATQPGLLVARVSPGSVAHAAGLRAGDRITRIGTTDVSSRTTAESLLLPPPRGPTFIVFERDSVAHGALVQP